MLNSVYHIFDMLVPVHGGGYAGTTMFRQILYFLLNYVGTHNTKVHVGDHSSYTKYTLNSNSHKKNPIQ